MKENFYLVSIGIPFYNCEKYLEFAIKSVINQSYSNWELILLDDGSSDNSINIARKFKDERIKIISDNENKGLVNRLNQLTKLAKGKYYARMDADDIMHIDRIKTQVEFLVCNNEVDVVGSRYYSIDINNNVVGITDVNLNPNSIKSILKYGCFAHPSILGKTEWFRNNPYDEKYNTMMEDYELWLRTVSSSNFSNIIEPLFYYRSVGIPTIRKYIRQTFNVIKVLQKREKYQLTIYDSIYYSLKNFFKILTYCVFYLFGQVNFLVRMRSRAMTTIEVEKATNDISRSIL